MILNRKRNSSSDISSVAKKSSKSNQASRENDMASDGSKETDLSGQLSNYKDVQSCCGLVRSNENIASSKSNRAAIT